MPAMNMSPIEIWASTPKITNSMDGGITGASRAPAQVVAVARATPEQIWIRDLASRLPFGKVVVAIANKHARQAWAMLARGEDYDAHAWLKHPMVQRPASKRRQQACS